MINSKSNVYLNFKTAEMDGVITHESDNRWLDVPYEMVVVMEEKLLKVFLELNALAAEYGASGKQGKPNG